MNDLIEIIMDDARKIVEVLPFTDLRKKKILITGASGIIGINLLACLKELSTTCSSAFSVAAVIQNEPLPYMKNLCDYSLCSILQGDLSDVSFCETLPPANLLHAAGYGNRATIQNPVKTLQLNTSTTLLLFEKLLPGGKFLFISSSELFADIHIHRLLNNKSERQTQHSTSLLYRRKAMRRGDCECIQRTRSECKISPTCIGVWSRYEAKRYACIEFVYSKSA